MKKLATFLVIFIFILTVHVLSFTTNVTFDIQTNTDTNFILFYYNEKIDEYPFDDSNMSDIIPINAGRHSITIPVPKRGLPLMRIDLSNTPSIIAVYDITVRNSPFTYYSIKRDDLVNAFPTTNDISEFWFEDGAVVYNVIGTDGYIAADKSISESVEVIVYKNFSSLFVIYFISTILTILIFTIIKYKNKFKTFSVKCKIIFFDPKNLIQKFIGISTCLVLNSIIAVLIEVLVLKMHDFLTIASLDIFSKFFANCITFNIHRVVFFFNIFLIPVLCLWLGKNKAIKYRYVLAVLLLVVMTLGKYTGSSIGYYDNMLLGNTANHECSTLLGVPRGIRGDEWATEKPWYFAQVNGKEHAPYYNSDLMIDGEDMVVSAFAPVNDPIIIFRPELIGFLFMPSDYAFAFYWYFRLIACFMAAFELFRVLSKRTKYALLGATAFIFAPPVRWWLSQHLLDTYIYGFYALVLFNNYFENTNLKTKILSLLGVFYMLSCYIMTMYPAQQVPLAYVFLSIIVWIICKNWSKKPLSFKNIINYVIAFSPFAILLIRFAFMSVPAIKTMLDTTFPGNTRAWLPLEWDYYLYRLVNPFTSFVDPNFLNHCEISQFYTFEIILIPLVIYFTYKYKKKCFLPAILCAVSIILSIIAHLPRFDLFAKITLLNMSYPVRILISCGVGYTLTLFSLLPLLEDHFSGVKKSISAIISVVFFTCIIVLAINSENVVGYFSSFSDKCIGCFILIATVVLLSYMAYCLLCGGKRKCTIFAVLLVALNVFSTIAIDPVTRGTDSMFEKTTMAKIREIDASSQGKWMISGSPTIANLVCAQGVERTSGTYYYPDWEMFEIIDPEHKFIHLWKQYAHIDMRLADGENTVTDYDKERNIQLDATNKCVYINYETAKKLDVKYVFTEVEIPEEFILNNYVSLLYEDKIDAWKIYRINY